MLRACEYRPRSKNTTPDGHTSEAGRSQATGRVSTPSARHAEETRQPAPSTNGMAASPASKRRDRRRDLVIGAAEEADETGVAMVEGHHGIEKMGQQGYTQLHGLLP